jgi:hypothetical protein
MTHRLLACLVATVALAAACGGEQPEATQPANPAPSAMPAPSATEAPAASAAAAATAAPTASAPPAEAAPTQPGPGDWDKWSHEQKLAWMKAAVMPKMGQAFHDYDASKYGDNKCTLCHGDGAKDGSFKMPNPGLPKLPASPAGFKKLAKDKPKILKFMRETVEPQMAALVGEQPFDMKTNKGFGCFECHTKQ